MNIFQNLLDEQQPGITPPDDFPVDEDDPPSFSLGAEYKKEQIREKKIKNEESINNLISRTKAQAMIEQIGQEIQNSFVDLARREAPVIAALLQVPHLERDLEKLLSEKIQVSIESVVGTCTRLSGEGFFDE